LEIGVARILIVCPDHVKREMSGPAIRYFELSHQLARAAHEVVLSQRARTSEIEMLRALAPRQDVIIVQGAMLDAFPFLARAGACLVADLYCPVYLEQIVESEHAGQPNGTAPLIETLRISLDTLRRADFFICASEKQRDYWLGMLTAVNRINSATYSVDHALRALIDVVPFGLSEEPPRKQAPAIRDAIDGIDADDFILLWGSSIYNWFDPLTLIRAIQRAKAQVPNLRLVVLSTHTANPDLDRETWMLAQARKLSQDLGLTGRHVFFNETLVPYDHRSDWLLDADVGVSTHFDHIEGHFSFRVRFLDYLWAGLPILCTAGDTIADAVEREKLGIAVPAGDVDGLAKAIRKLADPKRRAAIAANVRSYASTLTWSQAAQVLLTYCSKPTRAPDLAGLPGGKLMPVPLWGYAQVAVPERGGPVGLSNWRYYTVNAVDTLVYNGPLEVIRKAGRLFRRSRQPRVNGAAGAS
jgi:glycosyltransferase involved in cell wall biosynthesis